MQKWEGGVCVALGKANDFVLFYIQNGERGKKGS